MTQARKLNIKGIEYFQNYLHDLHTNQKLAPPNHILDDPNFSDEVEGSAQIKNLPFKNRLHMAQFLTTNLQEINTEVNIEHRGLWSWLSLYYFDQVAPKGPDGKRNPGRDYRHILEKGYRYRHRHLIAGPFLTYRMHKEKARLLLDGPVHQENNFHHELGTRQAFITNPSIIGAADTLYFDEQRNCPKRGALSKTKPGTLLRFIDVVQQLELTYDLYSMDAQTIIELLPDEFTAWNTVSTTDG